MDNSKNTFLKIDHAIFKKLDFIIKDHNILKMNDFLFSLKKDQHNFLSQMLTFSFILLPYIVAASLWWANFQTKKRLDIKTQILEQISLLNNNKTIVKNTNTHFLAPAPIQSSDELENKIKNIARGSNISLEKIKIINFNLISSTTNITKVETSLRFTNFGTKDFSNFMKGLIEIEKFKTTKFKIEKVQLTNLLQGEISLIHLGNNSII